MIPKTIKVGLGMRGLFIGLCVLALAACNDNNSATNNSEKTSPEKTVAVESTKLDLQQLPATVSVTLELDPRVEEGFDAFGMFSQDGQVVTVGVSEDVAKAGGIDITRPFTGDVTITIDGEHAVSRELYRVYTVSGLNKK